jgi:hypothetical protein
MKLSGYIMDIGKMEQESYEVVPPVPSSVEYSHIKHEDEPLPFTFAAVKTEVEVSCS